jgi:hypothetical protein
MRPHILNRVEWLGFKVFDNGDYDLNIIGERFKGSPERFDDILHVCYKLGGLWQHHRFKCTTEPSVYWLNNPMRVGGTAVVMSPQQMRSAFELGKHKNTYPCLRQRKEVKVWRDANKDAVIDYGDLNESTAWAIQIHRASANKVAQSTNKWSAGCTVVQDPTHYDNFIELCRAQINTRGWHSFTYTIIDGE